MKNIILVLLLCVVCLEDRANKEWNFLNYYKNMDIK